MRERSHVRATIPLWATELHLTGKLLRQSLRTPGAPPAFSPRLLKLDVPCTRDMLLHTAAHFRCVTSSPANMARFLVTAVAPSSRLLTGLRIAINLGDDACVNTLSVASINRGAGEEGSIQVTAPEACSWDVHASEEWVNVLSASVGTGNRNVLYKVSPSDILPRRTAAVYIVQSRLR
jgi:hypothetical protein